MQATETRWTNGRSRVRRLSWDMDLTDTTIGRIIKG